MAVQGYIPTDISVQRQGLYVENDTPLTKQDKYDSCVPSLACLVAWLLVRERRRSSIELYCFEKFQLAAARGGHSSNEAVKPENEKSSRPLRTAVPVLKLCYQRKEIQPAVPGTAVPLLNLYYQRTKIQPAARDGCSSINVVFTTERKI